MKKAVKFSIIVCLVSWAFAAIMFWGIGIHDVADRPIAYTLCAMLYMFLPMLCAMAIQLLSKEKFRSTGLLKFRVRWSWVVAWLMPLAITALAILINSLIPGCELTYNPPEIPNIDSISEAELKMIQLLMNPWVMVALTIVSGLLSGVTINAVAAFGEEYGWRNYLVNALKTKKFWLVCLFIGIVWGFWHFPIILMGHNYYVHRIAGVFVMVGMCLALTPIELYFVLKAKSVYPAAILHGTFNAVAGIAVFFINGGNDLLNGCAGLAGIIAMALTIIAIFVYDRFVSKENIMSKTIEEVIEN